MTAAFALASAVAHAVPCPSANAARRESRPCVLPAGLSNASVRGMVAAHVGARHIDLSKLASAVPQPQGDDTWLRHLLAAVAAGSAARWQGRAVESLRLSGCAALTDADIEMLSESMPELR